MNAADEAKARIKERDRLEGFAISIGFLSQFILHALNKYTFHQYLPSNEMFGWMIFIFGIPIGPLYIWITSLQKKFVLHTGCQKKKMIEKLEVAIELNDPQTWRLYQQESRLRLIGGFCYSSSLGGCITPFLFKLTA